MPWTETVTMQRLQFVAACLEGSLTVAEVCRRFNISRKTGYKWLARFRPTMSPPSVTVPGRAITSAQRLNPW
nr:helix-turn-helix domain-containing protein [Kosakonia cowanii]